jgi:hypothetical protein
MNKEIIPLMVQPKYRPDGWLGMIVGTKLYYDFSGKHPFDKKLADLMKVLGHRAKPGAKPRIPFPEKVWIMREENSILPSHPQFILLCLLYVVSVFAYYCSYVPCNPSNTVFGCVWRT